MIPEALQRQDSLAPLLKTLAQVTRMPTILPEPIMRAALGLLAQRVPVRDGRVSAASLEEAVSRSGVSLEASLAKGAPAPGDVKALLLSLRDALSRWTGDSSPPSLPRDPAPPPRGHAVRMPDPADPPPLPDTARDIGRLLHTQSDAAVSRIKLLQAATLPESHPALSHGPGLRMELPFLVGHELVMAQIQIAREGRRRGADQRRGWIMRFALNFSATGEVGAEVGLLGKAINVSLWAADPQTADALTRGLPELQRTLEEIGLDPGPIRVRHGLPEEHPPATGHLVDSVT